MGGSTGARYGCVRKKPERLNSYERKERWQGHHHHCCCCGASSRDHQILRPWRGQPPPRTDLNYRPLPRPLAVVAAAVQVREDKKRERNKKRQLRRRAQGKEAALAAAAAAAALKEGEEKEAVVAAAIVAAQVRKETKRQKKEAAASEKEKKKCAAQLDEGLMSKLKELGQLSTDDKEFILSMLDKLISAFIKRGEKEKEREPKEAVIVETKEGIAADIAFEKEEKTEEKPKKVSKKEAGDLRRAELHKAIDVEEAAFRARWAREWRDPEKFGRLPGAFAKRWARLRAFAEEGVSESDFRARRKDRQDKGGDPNKSWEYNDKVRQGETSIYDELEFRNYYLTHEAYRAFCPEYNGDTRSIIRL